jgi:hypothetical protein
MISSHTFWAPVGTKLICLLAIFPNPTSSKMIKTL